MCFRDVWRVHARLGLDGIDKNGSYVNGIDVDDMKKKMKSGDVYFSVGGYWDTKRNVFIIICIATSLIVLDNILGHTSEHIGIPQVITVLIVSTAFHIIRKKTDNE